MRESVPMRMNTFSAHETELFVSGIRLIAGVDEAGRGPLAGPVVAAAVIFPPWCIIEGIDDSKALNESRRAELDRRIRADALSVGVGIATPGEIDEINILQASILAMHRAVESLAPQPDFLLVDGNRFHHPRLRFRTVVKGDARCFSIAAASIVAKVHRDALMQSLDREYPEYGFSRHKGYPTRAHVAALLEHGYSPEHRRSFSVKALAAEQPAFTFHETERGTHT